MGGYLLDVAAEERLVPRQCRRARRLDLVIIHQFVQSLGVVDTVVCEHACGSENASVVA